MQKNIKLIFISLIIVFVIGLASYYRGINSVIDKNSSDVMFVVSKGESVKQIGDNLVNAGLIKSKFYFETYVWRTKNQANLQAGEYIINPRQSIKEIVAIFVAGDAAIQERTIKIIEGWNLRDIGQYFEREGMFQSEELLELVGFPKIDYRVNTNMSYPKDYSGKFSFLSDKPKYYSLEGYLFPDTYRIYEDATLDDIVVKMLNNFEKKLTSEMRAEITKQGKSIYEIITLASLIEKEVRIEKDMKIVSGVFWDRIKNGQPLESCATLAYILGENKPQYSLEDTKIDSPYNSYLILGLPPTPISNPGLKAIKAAIYPEFTKYNYFLNRFDNGETVFSETYEEHLKNKAKYLD